MLLDTSGLFALCNQAEAGHKAARSLYDSALRRLTHSFVIAEFIALSHARRFPRNESVQFLNELLTDGTVTVIWVDLQLTKRALDLLRRRPDKGYSLCDAVSFLVMQDYDVFESLTNDRHFVQEGFQRLLS